MRGIDEETLLAVRASLAAEGLNTDVIDALISLKIRELNPWLPIENAPNDRRILLMFENGYGVVVACEGYFCNLDGGYWAESVNCDEVHPTHYKEL